MMQTTKDFQLISVEKLIPYVNNAQNAFQGTDFEAAFLAAGIWIHQSDFD